MCFQINFLLIAFVEIPVPSINNKQEWSSLCDYGFCTTYPVVFIRDCGGHSVLPSSSIDNPWAPVLVYNSIGPELVD